MQLQYPQFLSVACLFCVSFVHFWHSRGNLYCTVENWSCPGISRNCKVLFSGAVPMASEYTLASTLLLKVLLSTCSENTVTVQVLQFIYSNVYSISIKICSSNPPADKQDIFMLNLYTYLTLITALLQSEKLF